MWLQFAALHFILVEMSEAYRSRSEKFAGKKGSVTKLAARPASRDKLHPSSSFLRQRADVLTGFQ